MSTQVENESVEPKVEAPVQESVSPPAAVDPKVAPPVEKPEPEEGAEPPPAAAYKPREKFKVLDSEHEVPAWLKSTMKDDVSEKQAIELLEKAYGLEPVKTRLADTRKERDTLKTEFTKVQHSIEEMRKTYQRGDIDAFLDKLSIPHERMLQWALGKVEYSQLPPEQQRILDERQAAQRQAWTAEQQNQFYQTQLQEQTRSVKSTLLESSLARPDVSAFQHSFDSRVGRPGAFREEIIAQGELAWIQSEGKNDLTPEQAIEKVMAKWRNAMTTPGAAAPAAVSPGTPAALSAKPSVIPNIQGGSQSPMKSKPRSIDDLKKLSAKMNAG